VIGDAGNFGQTNRVTELAIAKKKSSQVNSQATHDFELLTSLPAATDAAIRCIA
jgi:hypothetical protein